MLQSIDGRVTSYFEWIGAGIYCVDERSGSMHGKKFLVKEAHFGSDGANFYLRVDFHPGHEQELTAMEAKLTVQPLDGAPASSLSIAFPQGSAAISEAKLAGGSHQVECAFARVPGHPRRPRPALPVFTLARRSPHGRRSPARLAGNGRHRPGGNGGVKDPGRHER